jgi:hypothetical protein
VDTSSYVNLQVLWIAVQRRALVAITDANPCYLLADVMKCGEIVVSTVSHLCYELS